MASKREQLVQTAVELFSQHGFHGTGIDRIAREAGVTKKTLYNHFRSKEELILAALRDYDVRFRNDFMKAVEKRWDTPYEKLLGIFEVAQDWFSGDKFFGCMFINAISEYSDPDTAIRQVCKEFKRLMSTYIKELTIASKVPDPENLSAQIALLFEGAIVTAQVDGDAHTAQATQTAQLAAKVLVDAQLAR